MEKKTLSEWRELSKVFEMDKKLSFLPYQNKDVRQAIWEIKYRRNKILKSILGDIASEYILEELADKLLLENFAHPIISGIPASSRRNRDKGFNQSEDIGKYIALKLKIPYLMLLEKTRETVRQTTLKKQERLLNVQNSFSLNKKAAETLKGKNIILFDDVTTTGATLNEARKILLLGGAKKVICFTLAH